MDGLFLNIGTGFYCGAKYGSVQQLNECAQDALCHFQLDDFACRALPETFAEGSRKGLMVRTAAMTNLIELRLHLTEHTVSHKGRWRPGNLPFFSAMRIDSGRR